MLTLLLALAQSPLSVPLYEGKPLAITQMLAIPPVGKSGRIPFSTDPIAYSYVSGTWSSPKEGDTVAIPGGATKVWKRVTADKNGTFTGDEFEGGYAFCKIHSDKETTVLLHAIGDSALYLNGQLSPGDPYGYGYVKLPVTLHEGDNSLLFVTGRGEMKLSLEPPAHRAFVNTADLTLPDGVVALATQNKYGGVVIVNADVHPLKNALLTASLGKSADVTTKIEEVPPQSVVKVPFRIPQPNWVSPGEFDLHLTLSTGREKLEEESVKFRVRTPAQTRKETYISTVDNSVQYFAVVPPKVAKAGLAMILSVHGASVEATSQADAYSPKDWAWISCATNRRPFGFDWEDWGRRDAMDVLATSKNEFRTDPVQQYVTGHSMGGHGTWQLGAIYPDKFAAIGVSAGWESFFSYVGVPRPQNPTPMESIFERANSTSATLDMKDNFRQEGVYILHGDADDNVPVTEARHMKEALQSVALDFGYHEQKGAGHWWDGPAAPGADCLEWPEMMEFLGRHRLTLRQTFEFTTVNLRANNECWGVKILEQEHPLLPSHLHVRRVGQILSVDTKNVRRISLPPTSHAQVVLDGASPLGSQQEFGSNVYERTNGTWRQTANSKLGQVGPFKAVFDNGVLLVYGTNGSPEENRFAFEKARYDSEAYWYRGNGHLQVMSDTEFLSRHRADRRNVVLYGNADTNAAWSLLFSKAPIQMRRDGVRAGAKVLRGDQLACLFCFRRPNGNLAGAICWSGRSGALYAQRLPYFTSGVGFPDWMISGPETLKSAMDGVIGAGYFTREGSLEKGDYEWR